MLHLCTTCNTTIFLLLLSCWNCMWYFRWNPHWNKMLRIVMHKPITLHHSSEKQPWDMKIAQFSSTLHSIFSGWCYSLMFQKERFCKSAILKHSTRCSSISSRIQDPQNGLICVKPKMVHKTWLYICNSSSLVIIYMCLLLLVCVISYEGKECILSVPSLGERCSPLLLESRPDIMPPVSLRTCSSSQTTSAEGLLDASSLRSSFTKAAYRE